VGLGAFVAVGGGAAVGAWVRWGLSLLLNPVFPNLPLGTLAANVIGGYLMGLAMGLIGHYEAMPVELRLLLTTGFLGGLTTFSTFSAETVSLMQRQQYGWTAVLITAHVLGSVLATLLGMESLRWLLKA
jgi:CrcB protein